VPLGWYENKNKILNNNNKHVETSGSHGEVYKDECLMGCCAI
jgi:hypothetical protein